MKSMLTCFSLSLIMISLLPSCRSGTSQKNQFKLRNSEQAILPTLEGTPLVNLKGPVDVFVKREALDFNGQLRKNANQPLARINECEFLYTKGEKVDGDSNYFFENMTVSLLGSHREGFFTNRFTFTNAALENSFQRWNFNESFGPVQITRKVAYYPEDIEGSLQFERSARGGAVLTLKSNFQYLANDSQFIDAGKTKVEKVMRVIFKEFNEEVVKLESVDLVETHLNSEGTHKIVDINCRNFRPGV